MKNRQAVTASTHPYAAFRIPGLLRYLLGSILVQIGMGAQGLAIGWEVYQRTHHALALGLVGGVQAIPMLLFTLPAGYLADRFDRRRIIACCLIGVAVCSLGLAWESRAHGAIHWMYLLLGLDATLMTLQRPASISIFPSLVPPEVFENAVKWRSSLDQLCAVAGPALGAVIIAWSIAAAYTVNALFALVFIGLLLSLRLKPSPTTAGAMSLANILAGVRFVFSRKVLLATISLDLFAVLLGGAVYLLPAFAHNAHQLGWLRAAPAVGACCMAVTLAHLPPMRRAGRAMLLAVIGFGLATIVFGFSHNFLLSWAMLFLTGAFDNISVVVRHTLVQMLTPDEMRGRVSAVNWIFIGSSNEIGGLESGLLAQLTGTRMSVKLGGLGTLAVVAIWSLCFPNLRRFGALASLQEEEPRAVEVV